MSRTDWLIRKHSSRPKAVGRRMDRRVHFRLPVSLWMVSRVVAQGQWNRVKMSVQAAVVVVQPWAARRAFRVIRLPGSVRLPCSKYAIRIRGITISLAGRPRMKAIRITPSNPMREAKGARKDAQRFRRLMPFIRRFAIAQIRIPAGMAAVIARPRMNRVRSRMERIRILQNCGRR